jgi:hypothetical protein
VGGRLPVDPRDKEGYAWACSLPVNRTTGNSISGPIPRSA